MRQQTSHNPEVAGSNPAPATAKGAGDGAFRFGEALEVGLRKGFLLFLASVALLAGGCAGSSPKMSNAEAGHAARQFANALFESPNKAARVRAETNRWGWSR